MANPVPDQRGSLDAVRLAMVDAAEALEETDCIFWACPGPLAPFEDMKTCRPHAAALDIRSELARFDAARAALDEERRP